MGLTGLSALSGLSGLILVSVGADVTPPAYSSGEIGDVDDGLTVVVTFSEVIITSSNYTNGVTIKVNGVAQVISSGTLQGDNLTVYYVIPQAAIDATITFEYLDATGDIQDVAGNQLGDVVAQTQVNNIGRHLYYQNIYGGAHLPALYA